MAEYITTVTITEKATIRVHRPILTDEERAKRLEAIRKAAADVILAANKV